MRRTSAASLVIVFSLAAGTSSVASGRWLAPRPRHLAAQKSAPAQEKPPAANADKEKEKGDKEDQPKQKP